MKEVVCWCCENFVLDETLFANSFKKEQMGRCMLTKELCSSEDVVCKKFLLRSGLHTKRTIPEYCKNYISGRE